VAVYTISAWLHGTFTDDGYIIKAGHTIRGWLAKGEL
jgi:hypothetical protein